jgi:hypothetical protein
VCITFWLNANSIIELFFLLLCGKVFFGLAGDFVFNYTSPTWERKFSSTAGRREIWNNHSGKLQTIIREIKYVCFCPIILLYVFQRSCP